MTQCNFASSDLIQALEQLKTLRGFKASPEQVSEVYRSMNAAQRKAISRNSNIMSRSPHTRSVNLDNIRVTNGMPSQYGQELYPMAPNQNTQLLQTRRAERAFKAQPVGRVRKGNTNYIGDNVRQEFLDRDSYLDAVNRKFAGLAG
jgi:hypothetical protein